MAFSMIIWHFAFDNFLGGTFNIYNTIATYIIMLTGSVFIELVSLKVVFEYNIKQLLIPVIIGNISSYALFALFKLTGNL